LHRRRSERRCSRDEAEGTYSPTPMTPPPRHRRPERPASTPPRRSQAQHSPRRRRLHQRADTIYIQQPPLPPLPIPSNSTEAAGREGGTEEVDTEHPLQKLEPSFLHRSRVPPRGSLRGESRSTAELAPQGRTPPKSSLRAFLGGGDREIARYTVAERTLERRHRSTLGTALSVFESRFNFCFGRGQMTPARLVGWLPRRVNLVDTRRPSRWCRTTRLCGTAAEDFFPPYSADSFSRPSFVLRAHYLFPFVTTSRRPTSTGTLRPGEAAATATLAPRRRRRRRPSEPTPCPPSSGTVLSHLVIFPLSLSFSSRSPSPPRVFGRAG